MKRWLGRLIGLGVAMLIVATIATGRESSASLTAERDDLSGTLTHLAAKHGVCAVVAAVIKARRLQSIISAANCDLAPLVGPQSVFQVASLSKPLFGYAVFKLAQQGKFDLQTPLGHYLPQGYRHRPYPYLQETSEKSELVTDEQVLAATGGMALNHTSGLPNWSDGPLKSKSAPGSTWHYSGEGYVLLQRAVEQALGTDFDTFMGATFKSLSMDHSAYTFEPRFAKDFVPATNARGEATKVLAFSEPIGAATLFTSAEDYANFLVALLNDKTALNAIVNSTALADPDLPIYWGLGWALERQKGHPIIVHWGICPGYRSFAMASAETGDGLVILTNSENGLALAEPIANLVIPGEHPIFQFPMLRSQLNKIACETLSLCRLQEILKRMGRSSE